MCAAPGVGGRRREVVGLDAGLHDVHRARAGCRDRDARTSCRRPRTPRAPGRSARARAASKRSIRCHCCVIRYFDDRVGRLLRVPPPDLRFDVVREEDRRAGQPLRQVDDRRQEVADDRVERAGREQLPRRARDRRRSGTWRPRRGPDRRGSRPRRRRSATCPWPHRCAARSRAASRPRACRAIGLGLRRILEREIGDVVARGEVPHDVPRAQLAALVERQQQAGVEPEQLHADGPAASAAARCATGTRDSAASARRRRR